MNEKVIDMSMLSDWEAASIADGWRKFNENTKIPRYFGYVDKTDLKAMNKAFKYVDTKSWVSGVVVGAGLVLGYGYYKLRKKKTKEENVPKEES